MKLLISTTNKIICYHFLLILLEGTNHEQSSQNNQSTWCFDSQKYGGIFPKIKKSFSCGWGGGVGGGTNIFGQKFYGEVILIGRTNDQILPSGEV